jgi:hypothetical protein
MIGECGSELLTGKKGIHHGATENAEKHYMDAFLW